MGGRAGAHRRRGGAGGERHAPDAAGSEHLVPRRTARRRAAARRAHSSGDPRGDRRQQRPGSLGLHELFRGLDGSGGTRTRTVRPPPLPHSGRLAPDGGVRRGDRGRRRTRGDRRGPRNALGTGDRGVGATAGHPLDRPRSGGPPDGVSRTLRRADRGGDLPGGLEQRHAAAEPGRGRSGRRRRVDDRGSDAAAARIRRENPHLVGGRRPRLGRGSRTRGDPGDPESGVRADLDGEQPAGGRRDARPDRAGR